MTLSVERSNIFPWLAGLEDLSTLGDGEWASSIVMDCYLQQTWKRFRARHPRRAGIYMPVQFLKMKRPPTRSEISTFRSSLNIQRGSLVPKVPLFGVVHDSDHYYVIYVRPTQRDIHFLGKDSGG